MRQNAIEAHWSKALCAFSTLAKVLREHFYSFFAHLSVSAALSYGPLSVLLNSRLELASLVQSILKQMFAAGENFKNHSQEFSALTVMQDNEHSNHSLGPTSGINSTIMASFLIYNFITMFSMNSINFN